MDRIANRFSKPLNPKMDKTEEKAEEKVVKKKTEFTSSATGKDIKYFTQHVSYPGGPGYQIVQNTDGTLDLYASDTDGSKELYKDKDSYIGTGYLVIDRSRAHDNEEYSIYKLFKRFIDKMPPKTAQNVRDQVNGNKEKHIISWYKFREYFEEI